MNSVGCKVYLLQNIELPTRHCVFGVVKVFTIDWNRLLLARLLLLHLQRFIYHRAARKRNQNAVFIFVEHVLVARANRSISATLLTHIVKHCVRSSPAKRLRNWCTLYSKRCLLCMCLHRHSRTTLLAQLVRQSLAPNFLPELHFISWNCIKAPSSSSHYCLCAHS